jgi:hypothetical protein
MSNLSITASSSKVVVALWTEKLAAWMAERGIGDAFSLN